MAGNGENASTSLTAITRRRRSRAVIALGFVLMALTGAGFIWKFIQFIHTLKADPAGQFTVVPIINYALVTAGFTCILVWATLRGMFRDIEKPKHTMLEREAWLEQEN